MRNAVSALRTLSNSSDSNNFLEVLKRLCTASVLTSTSALRELPKRLNVIDRNTVFSVTLARSSAATFATGANDVLIIFVLLILVLCCEYTHKVGRCKTCG